MLCEGLRQIHRLTSSCFTLSGLTKRHWKKKVVCGLLQRAREGERERAHERTHVRETTYKRKRIPGSCTCPAAVRGKYDRSVGPRVRIESLVLAWSPWISTSLYRLKAKSKAKKVKGSRTPHVVHVHSLTPSLSGFLKSQQGQFKRFSHPTCNSDTLNLWPVLQRWGLATLTRNYGEKKQNKTKIHTT